MTSRSAFDRLETLARRQFRRPGLAWPLLEAQLRPQMIPFLLLVRPKRPRTEKFTTPPPANEPKYQLVRGVPSPWLAKMTA